MTCTVRLCKSGLLALSFVSQQKAAVHHDIKRVAAMKPGRAVTWGAALRTATPRVGACVAPEGGAAGHAFSCSVLCARHAEVNVFVQRPEHSRVEGGHEHAGLPPLPGYA